MTDIEGARAELVSHGVEVSEVFHDVGGVFHHAGTTGRVPGPDPQRRSYASFASFSDRKQRVVLKKSPHAFLADDVAGDLPALLTSIDGSDSVLSGLPAKPDRSERVWE